MKGSAVQAFRGLVDRIHPQIALSPKESERLLKALTTSFRQQLDQVHPQPQAVPNVKLGHRQQESTRNALPSSHPPPTDGYLASVLTNPLLARVDSTQKTGSMVTASMQENRRHPIKVFEDYVSRGLATMEVAALCLDEFRSSLSGMSTAQAQQQIKRMDAGARVLRWLWTSTYQPMDMLAQSQALLANLSYFLVAEGREEALWELMPSLDRPIIVNSRGKNNVFADPRALLLRSIVTAHIARGDLESAVASFLQATKMDASMADGRLTPQTLLRSVGIHLSNKLLDRRSTNPTTATFVTNFEGFVNSCKLWEKAPQEPVSYRVAVLELHHPANPDSADALAYIRHISEDPTPWFQESLAPKRKSRTLEFLFTTVKVLQMQNLHDDAIWVMVRTPERDGFSAY